MTEEETPEEEEAPEEEEKLEEEVRPGVSPHRIPHRALQHGRTRRPLQMDLN